MSSPVGQRPSQELARISTAATAASLSSSPTAAAQETPVSPAAQGGSAVLAGLARPSRAASSAGSGSAVVEMPATPPRPSAARLKQTLAALETPQQQRAAFDAARDYQAHGPRGREVAWAVGHQAGSLAGVAVATFGAGRNLGNVALDAVNQLDSGRTDMPAAGGTLAYTLSSAVGGTLLNMAAQALVPKAVDTVFGHKMTPVPAAALVPQRLDVEGQPIPLSPQEHALRQQIQETQARLSGVGSVANTAVGALSFGAAQAGRVMAEGALRPPSAGPAHPAEQVLDIGKAMIGVGAGAAVSAAGGTLMGTAMAVNMARASVKVPDPDPARNGALVEMKLFYPAPATPAARPPWAGSGGEVAASTGMRLANLAVAAVPLQTAATVALRAASPAVGAGAQVAGMLAGATTYFQGQGLIGGVETARAART